MNLEMQTLEERVLVEVPRGRSGGECLRVRFIRARMSDGKEVCWHDIREFYRGEDDQWKTGKKGITVRSKELATVVEALASELAAQAAEDTAT